MNQKFKLLTISALLLLLTFSAIAVILPTADAHTPAWVIPTYAFISASPNPVGLGQSAFVVMWVDKVLPGAAVDNDIRFHDYKLTITKPDGTIETQTWPIVTDTTSSQFTLFTPSQTGTYKFKFEFPGQTYTWTTPVNFFGFILPNENTNDTYLASSAETTLTVQQESVMSPPSYPLPTNYWTRPIEGQNTEWASIASNWLATPSSNFQPDGLAPNSAHIMWTKELEFGGVVGGTNIGISGATYYNGMSYEGRFGNPIIMQGRLYYAMPLSNSVVGGMGDASEGNFVCVDLQSGEELWTQKYAVNPTFGQLYWYDSPNQHGVIPNGYLWAVSGTTWTAYDAMTGSSLFSLTNVPAGTNVYGPNGEILRYVLGGNGLWLALWNNTAAKGLPGATSGADQYYWRPVGKTVDASAAYSWNVTLSRQVPFGSAINYVINDDVLLGSVGASAGLNTGTSNPYTIFTVSLKQLARGQVQWLTNYAAPSGNLTRQIAGFGTQAIVDTTNRVFIMLDKETSAFLGYSLDTGTLLWGPTALPRAYNYYSATLNSWDAGAHVAAYGNLYACGYGGLVYCFDTLTGQLKWTYGNGGEGNSTNSGVDTPWGYCPIFVSNIADGKVYLFTSEHSPNAPMYKGALLRAVDAYTGAELWTMSGWLSGGQFYAKAGAIADGYMTYFNAYDGLLYTVGKGPSATTLDLANDVVTQGQSLLIKGTVTDISAGAKSKVASGEFNIVPAVSDSSQSAWMAYIYMQKPCPTDATGVPVAIFATDANGDTAQIATVTSDSSGLFYYKWTPAQVGTYTITAVFEGSNSYWPSTTTTAIAIDPAPAATNPPTPTETPVATETPMETASPTVAPQPDNGIATETLLIAGVAVIIVVAVIVAALVLRKRK